MPFSRCSIDFKETNIATVITALTRVDAGAWCKRTLTERISQFNYFADYNLVLSNNIYPDLLHVTSY